MFMVPSSSVVSTYVLSFPVALDAAVVILGMAVAGACVFVWAASLRSGRLPPRPPRRRQPLRRIPATLGAPSVQAA